MVNGVVASVKQKDEARRGTSSPRSLTWKIRGMDKLVPASETLEKICKPGLEGTTER